MSSPAFIVSAPDLLLAWTAGLAAGFGLVVLYCWPLRKQVQALAACASHDPLTRLANGIYFRSDVAELQRTASSLVVMYIRLHRLDGQMLTARRTADLRTAAGLLASALPRCADRLYRMQTAEVEFGAILSDQPEVIGSRLALSILERLRPEGLTATLAIASSERLGWCDLALAAELRCQQQVQLKRGTWCIATEAPPKTPRPELAEWRPELLLEPSAAVLS